jgi:serine/threonine-protein kinase
MDDPEPLERVVRGVPSSFAAIVRKLMNKDPADRYRSCPELAADLERWTDPDVVRSIIGSAAESARAFRPPPPDLEDADLRWIDADAESSPGSLPSAARSLRDLGAAEPAAAPMHKSPPPPRRAVVVPADAFEYEPPPARARDESRYLIHFVAIALAIGILGIILIAILQLRS